MMLNLPDNRKTQKNDGEIWNLLTTILIVGMVLMVAYFGLIFLNPYLPINPFQPLPMPAAIVLPTPTNTPTALKEFPPTWTPTSSLEPSATNTPRPVIVTDTPTPYSIPHTQGPTTPTKTFTATVKPNMPYEISGTPVAVASTFTHPDSGCSWMGVGGQVLDLKNAPIVGVTIQLGGVLGDKYLDMLSLTGTALQYGPAGYEFTLADKPIASKKGLWLQLLDQAGLPLSSKVYFDTYNDCTKNLIIIKFKQVR